MKQYLIGAGAVVALLLAFIGGQNFKSQDNLFGGGGYRENTKELTVSTVVTSTGSGWGDGQSVVYYRNLGITLASTNATATVKIACSLADTEPTWASAQNATNTWDYVEIIDTEDGASIPGDTGIALTASTDVRLFEINSNNFRWCNANVTNTSTNDGYLNIKYKPADNQ